MTELIKIKVGKYLYPISMEKVGTRLELNFRYNKDLIEEVKCMEGARYHGFQDINPRKIWSIKDSPRNRFQLDYMSGKNPYTRYDSPLVIQNIFHDGLMYLHQEEMSSHILQRKQCCVFAEMGVGKTLSTIRVIELIKPKIVWWIGPRSALYSVQLEFEKWKAKITPKFYTYESLKKLVDTSPPEFIVYDEASRCKTPTAQRSQAALEIANNMRNLYDDPFIILLSGSPAPKSPADFWHLCEIACPGYLREGNILAFQKRLAFVKKEESLAGGSFYKIQSWKDNEEKCKHCGELKDNMIHQIMDHFYEPSKNEVKFLYERMKGLALVKFKKDCLSLPEKVYRIIRIQPTAEILRAASLIVAKAPSAIQALTLLRELSDGFQYRDEEVANEYVKCDPCHGSGLNDHWIDTEHPDEPLNERSIETGFRVTYDDSGNEVLSTERLHLDKVSVSCFLCHGSGQVPKIVRAAKEVSCPKEDALIELLDEHDDFARIVIYAGFTGSVDRVVSICKRNNWNTIRVDGRGWASDFGVNDPKDMLKRFQSENKNIPIAFVGQPGAAGMGLTLTASPTIVYYSNDFNAESRIQSEDRIHRPGCKGANIIDLIHLPQDELVLNNLKEKRRLQDLSLGQLKEMVQ